jgi:catecholate siderophore receptor
MMMAHPASLPFALRSLLSAASPWVMGTLLAPAAAFAQAAPLDATAAEAEIAVIGTRSGYGQSVSETAMKTQTPLRETPQAVSVITRDLMDDQAMRSMADVVRYAPGVTMGQGEGHRDAPTLRGNSSTADFYIDGVRDDVQYYRDLYNAERVEILKGPNALIFGRGGGGGVINRVSKSADSRSRHDATLTAGLHAALRGALDLGGVLGVGPEQTAGRLNLMHEDSESYRDAVTVRRTGVAPVISVPLAGEAEISLAYEYFDDERTVDRGIPSRNGKPLAIRRSAFFGNPDASRSDIDVHTGTAKLELPLTESLALRSVAVFADYGKSYANVHANSPVNARGEVSLQSYNSATRRQNIFNQTDVVLSGATGGIAHKLLIGFDVGNQDTDNQRAANNNAAGTVSIASPTIRTPIVFNPSRSNTFNHVDLTTAGVYAQEQATVLPGLALVAGMRLDRFDLDVNDRRPGSRDFARDDTLFSPRLGAIWTPDGGLLSFYASYSVSHLPQSGDQFASLDATTVALKPERFKNIEAGAKWDLSPGLQATAALYRLRRTNTRSLDPATNLSVLTGAQQSKGAELSLTGALTDAWDVVAGYSLQKVEITRTTIAAPAGRRVSLTPKHSFSFWNHYRLTEALGAGVGVVAQSGMFSSISNAVRLPGFTRVDAALFWQMTPQIKVQVNVENLLDRVYYPTAHNDNNITPGAPLGATIGVSFSF